MLYRKLAGARPFDSTRRWPETVAARWLDIRCLARGLRLAGASTVSVLIGFLLFYGAPQAQDLFLEVKGNTAAGVSFWLMFYFSVVFMWALPVYVSSRWILDRHDVDHDGYTATDRVPVWVRRNIPPLLTVLCFIAVMVGQLMALRNAPSVVDYSIAARLEFADTLWAGGQSMWRQIVATLQSAGIYAAHSLSVTIFFAIYIILGAGLLWMNLRGRAGRLSHRVWSVLWWLVTLLVFLPLFLMAAIFLWSFTEEQFRIAFSLGHLAVLPPVTAAAAYIAWWGMRPQPDGASRIGGLLLRLRRHAGERDETAASAKLINPIFFTLLASTVILILCGIILHPIGITEYVYRAQMLPVLLGLPVAFVTYLSDWSVRFRAPLIIAAILLVALGTSLIGDTNDVRTVSGAPARPSLKQSIERWAEVNECDLRAAEGPRKCPPPIIVTAAGGASRASFFVAGLVGKLLDEETALRTNGHTDPVVSASISGDGERILTASLQSIRLWHGRTGALIGILGKGSSYRDPLFSADGKRALTASTIFGARLWDVRSGKLIAVLDPAVESAIFTADGTRIVTIAGDSGPASLWDGATGELVAALGERARAALFSPDGKRLVTTTPETDAATLWDGVSGARIADLQGRPSWGDSLTFSPDGARLVIVNEETGSDGKSKVVARLSDTASGALLATMDEAILGEARAAFSPDSARFVLVPSDAPRLWDAASGAVIGDLSGHVGTVTNVHFSSDSARMITAPADVPRLWDARSGTMIAKLEGHASWAEGATFSPDGARAVTFAAKEDAKLWDGVTGAPLAVLTGHEGGATSATFNADGSRIATADPAHHMRLWNGATGALVAKIGGRSEGASWDVVFSPDGSRLLTNTYTPRAEGSDEWTATLWAAASGERLAILGGHKGGMNPSFTKDGSRILTVGPLYEAERLNDRTPRLWDGATGRPIAALDAAETRRFRPFGKQLFALSGVSGGALGSVFIYGALADGQTSRRAINGIGRPPCRKFNSDRLWFATALGEGVKGASPSGTELPWRKPDESWRGCLELVSAGDFLSPVFVALAANDPLRIDIRGDRAAILEQAWETRYASLTGQDTAMGAVRKGDAQSNAPSSTLAESLGAVRNRVLTADPKSWLPMLILNGTSVTTGRRIVASDIATVSDEQGSLSRLFRDAYDLHELFSETGPVGEPGRKTSEPRCPDCDIRLSTAATMSARFPVISPHGTIRNRDGEIVDHIVDGGYFENFGATSAMELAGALEANGLKPFVILVNNEPTLSGMDCIREDKRMDYSRDVASPAFSVFTSPMGALFATRGARGTHAAVELCTILGRERFAFVTVPADESNPNKTLSMSWWLSMNVQKHLHDQLDFGTNPDNDFAFLKIDRARALP